jgi:hypothetical protein
MWLVWKTKMRSEFIRKISLVLKKTVQKKFNLIIHTNNFD